MKSVLSLMILLMVLSIVACTKTNYVNTTLHDTTTVIHKDTTIIKDTLVKKDTLVNKDTVWEKTPRNPIVGLWVGTFKVNGDAVDSFYYCFAIQPNGIMYTTDINATATASATGPWQLTGTTFTSTLTGLNGGTVVFTQAVTATYDSVGGTLKGTNNYTSGSGLNTNFLLQRVQ